MGLLSSLFSRSGSADPASAGVDPADSLTQARSRARQRLIGAVVLVGIGVIGFPLLFETQPRPIPVDVPIEIPRKDSLPPLKLPAARAPAATAPAEPATDAAGSSQQAKQAPDVITETAAEAGIALRPTKSASEPRLATPKPEARVESSAVTPPEPRTEAKADPKADPKASARPESKPPATADASRAQAILEGRPANATASGASPRFIVQIGAFADPAQARETRLKVERLGLVTYTHVAQTPSGERIRVRVGPVPTRAEADKMAARLKAAGLPAAILTL